MKKALLAVALLSTLGMAATQAMAEDYTPGHASFQWAGTVPAQSDSGDNYFIVGSGNTTDFNNGQLVFSNTTKGVELTNSSTISFKVVKHDSTSGNKNYDPAVDTQPLSYTGTLTDFQVGINGLMSQDDKNVFAIHVDGQTKAVNDSFDKNKDANTTHLTIVKGEGTNTLQAADNVVVQAVLAIAPTDA